VPAQQQYGHRLRHGRCSGGQCPCPVNMPAGFTLVELLVAMAIMVILATLSISAFRGNDSDRISAATATLRNALEGARSRAIKSGQVRGLRLITDPNDGRIATSMVYVGAPDPGYDEGTDAKGVVIYKSGSWSFKTSAGTWTNLISRGLLTFPTRIEIPKDSGNWHIAKSSNGADTVILAGQYLPSSWDTTLGWIPSPRDSTVTTQAQSLPIEYRLELSPTILPGSEPILLPRTTCIDLDGSDIPSSWYKGTPSMLYSTTMDILFSPRGDVLGPVKAKGILHLRIANSSDQLLFQSTNTRSSGDAYVLPADPEHPAKAISVFAQTGGILISELNSLGDTNGVFNNEPANSSSKPYLNAIRGRETR